jgi:hypothetical protein
MPAICWACWPWPCWSHSFGKGKSRQASWPRGVTAFLAKVLSGQGQPSGIAVQVMATITTCVTTQSPSGREDGCTIWVGCSALVSSQEGRALKGWLGVWPHSDQCQLYVNQGQLHDCGLANEWKRCQGGLVPTTSVSMGHSTVCKQVHIHARQLTFDPPPLVAFGSKFRGAAAPPSP